MQKVNLFLLNFLIVIMFLSCDKSSHRVHLNDFSVNTKDNSNCLSAEFCSIIEEYIKLNQIPFDVIVFFHVMAENPNFIRLYSGRLTPPKDFFKAQCFLIIDNHIVICDLEIPNKEAYDISFINDFRRISTSDYPCWLIERKDGAFKVFI